ncbi:MAG TPA: hypothetical protein VM241_01365 [Candidatus Thermoplasmatota archaeon]|nr:hypothetical protein [Candidatus Thermoplasmatota archaeon]
MDGKAVAWVAYLPIPGLGWVPALAAPHDPLARYHARQGGLLVGLLYVFLLAIGLLGLALPAAEKPLALLAAPVLLLGAAGMAWGILGALRARYVRVRPVWDLCAAIWK